MSLSDDWEEARKAMDSLMIDDPQEHVDAVEDRYRALTKKIERASRIENSEGLMRLYHTFNDRLETGHEAVSARLPEGSPIKNIFDGLANLPASPKAYLSMAVGMASLPLMFGLKVAHKMGLQTSIPVTPLTVKPRRDIEGSDGPV